MTVSTPAFLKANYPRHFAASLFTIEAQNTEKLATSVGFAKKVESSSLPRISKGNHMKVERTPNGTAILTVCPDCDGEMKIERVDPHIFFGDKGFETHTFECSRCGNSKTYMMDPRTPE